MIFFADLGRGDVKIVNVFSQLQVDYRDIIYSPHHLDLAR